jgi:hypothetical protein
MAQILKTDGKTAAAAAMALAAAVRERRVS